MEGINIEQSYIKVEEIILKDNYTVEYTIKYSEDLSKCFIQNKNMFVKFYEDVSSVPNSILSIPLLCNIAPITWFMDATLIIDDIDKDFFDSFDEIKNGFQSMYKNLKIRGKVLANNTICNKNEDIKNKKSSTLFSGGIDSWATYINHVGEQPSMITVQGADIVLDDTCGWNLVKNKISDIGKLYNSHCIYIESNFKEFLNHKYLNELFKEQMYNWWVNVQHGLGLVGLVALISYINRITDIYIPSSYTEEFNKPWGSDPKIDNHIKWSNLRVHHDGYELSRQDKVNFITEYSKNNPRKNMDIRVCWEGREGINCCKCEKCCRTIVGIIASGLNPTKYGFDIDNSIYEHIRLKFKRRLWVFSDDEIFMWNDIKRHIKNNLDNSDSKDFLEWLKTYNIEIYAKKSTRLYNKFIRKIDRLRLHN